MQAIIDANANALSDPDRLALDQQLLIPGGDISLVASSQETSTSLAEEPITYTVQPNDTLYDIAAQFEVTVATIVMANQIADPVLIKVGQVLKIPGVN